MTTVIVEEIKNATDSEKTHESAIDAIADVVEEIKEALYETVNAVTQNEDRPKWPEITTQLNQALDPVVTEQLRQAETLGRLALTMEALAEFMSSQISAQEQSNEVVADPELEVIQEPAEMMGQESQPENQPRSRWR